MRQGLERRSLRALIAARGTGGRFIAGPGGRVAMDDLRGHSPFPGGVAALLGRSVLISTASQMAAVLAAIDLDGIAARMLLAPPGLPPDQLAAVAEAGGVDALVTDGADPQPTGIPTVGCLTRLGRPTLPRPAETVETEWVLFTSGTTGRAKLVRHTLESLAGHVSPAPPAPAGTVWGTFYDVRRYGGLSILMRALAGGASMVLSDAAEELGGFLRRAAAAGVTHMSGTPSHWRRAFMSAAAAPLQLRNVRMSGEIADQAVLDRARRVFPDASVVHAFATTEAGIVFEVADGLAGFPAAMLEGHGLAAELRLDRGTLRVRSARIASGYLGQAALAPGSFVDTGDLVECEGGRCRFTGRSEGVINVGGEKVFPEEVEAVIARHPAVLACLVRPRSSPVTGALVAADVVLAPGQDAPVAAVRAELLALCRHSLPPHKVPVSLRFVPALPIAASGKMVRHPA